jgi:hypothetical protein
MHISVQMRAVGPEKVMSYSERSDIISGNARYQSASDNATCGCVVGGGCAEEQQNLDFTLLAAYLGSRILQAHKISEI